MTFYVAGKQILCELGDKIVAWPMTVSTSTAEFRDRNSGQVLLLGSPMFARHSVSYSMQNDFHTLLLVFLRRRVLLYWSTIYMKTSSRVSLAEYETLYRAADSCVEVMWQLDGTQERAMWMCRMSKDR